MIKFAYKGLGPAVKAFREDDVDKGIRRFGAAVLGREKLSTVSRLQREEINDNPPTPKAEQRGGVTACLHPDEVSRIRVPVLLVNGEESISLFHRLADRLEELLSDVERMEVRTASHLVQEENPLGFNAGVLSFLRKVRDRTESGGTK